MVVVACQQEMHTPRAPDLNFFGVFRLLHGLCLLPILSLSLWFHDTWLSDFTLCYSMYSSHGVSPAQYSHNFVIISILLINITDVIPITFSKGKSGQQTVWYEQTRPVIVFIAWKIYMKAINQAALLKPQMSSWREMIYHFKSYLLLLWRKTLFYSLQYNILHGQDVCGNWSVIKNVIIAKPIDDLYVVQLFYLSSSQQQCTFACHILYTTGF